MHQAVYYEKEPKIEGTTHNYMLEYPLTRRYQYSAKYQALCTIFGYFEEVCNESDLVCANQKEFDILIAYLDQMIQIIQKDGTYVLNESQNPAEQAENKYVSTFGHFNFLLGFLYYFKVGVLKKLEDFVLADINKFETKIKKQYLRPREPQLEELKTLNIYIKDFTDKNYKIINDSRNFYNLQNGFIKDQISKIAQQLYFKTEEYTK